MTLALGRLWTRAHAAGFLSVVPGGLSVTNRPSASARFSDNTQNKYNNWHHGEMNLLGEDVIPTVFFFALVFYLWEIFLSVFQPKQAHESSLWRQTLPVCVLYEGRCNLLGKDLPWALFGCPWTGTWSIKPDLPPTSAPKCAHNCLWWSDTTTHCQVGIQGMCDEETPPVTQYTPIT